MDLDQIITDIAGLAVILVGLISLTESLLQTQIVGQRLPLIQGVVISLFAVSFGAVLMTQNASKAFQKLRLKSGQMLE